MAITVKNFIAQLAKATDDKNMIVNKTTDWLDIINDNGGELSPDVLFDHSTEIAYSTLDSATLEVDMSSTTTYEGLQEVKSIYLEDANDKQWPYDNWTFNKDTKILYLDPESEVGNTRALLSTTVFPSDTYDTIVINWQGDIPDTAGDGSIDLDKPELALFRKICIREGIRRTLLDHTKLDRYRTLVGRANEYTLLATIRDMTGEIELDKAKLTNTNTVKTF